MQLGAGGLHGGLEAVDGFDLGETMEHLEFGAGVLQLLACLFHRELVGLELHLGHVSFRGELHAVAKVFLGAPQVFLCHEAFAFHHAELLLEGAGFVFIIGEFGGLGVSASLSKQGPGGVACDALLDQIRL